MKFQLPLKLGVFLIAISLLLITPNETHAQSGNSSIYLSPSQGTFTVGSTFDVSVFVNTGGQPINAVALDLKFPADKLQVVNPTAGQSFISIWVTQPVFSNTNGTVNLKGGLPSPGINTSSGLITTVTFRAKTPGEAVIYVQNSSQVLANDGQGTDLLNSFGRGSYNLATPAPEGPIITSPSHPDQNKWYRDNNPLFSWESPDSVFFQEITSDITLEYSWSFDQDPNGLPNNEVDGEETSISFQDVESGIWYIHVKAKAGGIWGQASHYPVYIDAVPPADFTPELELHTIETGIRGVVSFMTTDQLSGIDHYEIKIESLSNPDSDNPFFTEVTSPWQTPVLEPGQYRLIVRAYDKAGNYIDKEIEFEIGASWLSKILGPSISIGSLEIPLVTIIPVPFIPIFIFLLLKRRKKRKQKIDPPPTTNEFDKVIENQGRPPQNRPPVDATR